jgi:transcriptional regulator with XRE-family HTH domain
MERMERAAGNVKYLRQQKGLTQQQFADLLGIKRSLLGAYEEGRAKPNMQTMERLIQIFGITIDQLLRDDLTRPSRRGAVPSPGATRVLAITVDKANRENIEFVPVKAAAGYLTGYNDPQFVAELPKFNLPNLKEGTYRAFELSGDSMIPIQPGSIIIGQFVERLDEIKDGHLYIVVSQRDGIVFKRLFNHISETGWLVLRSDNPAYQPYTLQPEEIMEIWKAKAYISSVFPEGEVSLHRLMETVLELKEEVQRLKN